MLPPQSGSLCEPGSDLSGQPSSQPDFRKEFPDLFQNRLGGNLGTPYTITIKEDAKPVCIYAPRKIAQPQTPKEKTEIDRMLKEDVTVLLGR